MTERRMSGVRRDLNDLVRDESGKCSPAKVGAMIGQGIAIKYLLEHWQSVITSWDILTILLSVLIAPDLFKKLLVMKYGGTDTPVVTTTVAASSVTTTAPVIESTDVRQSQEERSPDKSTRKGRK